MARLLVVVPASRRLCGRLVLLSRNGDTVCGPFRVLARASRRIARKHGNPNCARELPFGDPPAGSYALIGSLPPNTVHRRPQRFGRLGALLLAPRAGEALAALAQGRLLFALHGGRTDRQGRLFPTRGGLRLADGDLLTLVKAVNAAHGRGDPVEGLDLIDLADEEVRQQMALIPARRMRRRARRAPNKNRLEFMAVLAGYFGLPGGATVERRRFLNSVLLLVGGISLAACDRMSVWEPPRGDDLGEAMLQDGGAGRDGSGDAGRSPSDAASESDGGYTGGGGSG